MKKLALFFLGLGSLLTVSVSAANLTSQQQEPTYQEQCETSYCTNDTVSCQLPLAQEPCNPAPCNPAPCNPAPCQPDTVCNPVPCNPAPCNPGC